MKRREFLQQAGMAGILFPALARAQSKPCPPSTLQVSGGTTVQTSCNPASAADWQSRATGPGVLWAHDFSEPDEVAKWRFTSRDSLAATRSTVIFCDPQRVPDPVGRYGYAYRSRVIGTSLAADAHIGDTVIYLTDATEFPDPATTLGEHSGAGPTTHYEIGVGSRTAMEVMDAVAINHSTRALTLEKALTKDWSATNSGVCIGPSSSWNRILGCVTQAWNGKTTPDIGISRGFKNRDGFTDANGKKHDWRGSQYSFRGAYWGHPEYDALYNPVWPVSGFDTFSTADNLLFNDTFDGNEFWLQWRQYMSSTMWTGRPQGKIMYVQTANGSSTCQLYTGFDSRHVAGRRIYFQHDGQNGDGGPYNLYAPGAGDPEWEPPQNEWATWMLHVKPGRHRVAEGTIELKVATTGAKQWTTLCSHVGYPMHYLMPADSVANPPAYNCFNPRNYPNIFTNNAVGPSWQTNDLMYTQIILSSQEIPLPTA